MSQRSLLAKDWVFEVDATPSAAATWTRVRGLTTFEPEIKSKTEDDSDFDGDGWASEATTQRAWTLKIKGNRKRENQPGPFIPDAGQELLRKAGLIVGMEANLHVRWYRKDGAPDAYEGWGTVDYKGGGGKTTDLEPFDAEVIGQGKPVEITNPTA
ncbi:phage tail tube protein [Nonomuraea sp. NPDC050394]|uniref:phage tail tube protein n=1 Tax=Nonomuraea sp. NPDC050394 TaxID=3364363 RepID=UPI0037AACFEE